MNIFIERNAVRFRKEYNQKHLKSSERVELHSDMEEKDGLEGNLIEQCVQSVVELYEMYALIAPEKIAKVFKAYEGSKKNQNVQIRFFDKYKFPTYQKGEH